jgi:hypothetical protein
MREQLIYHGKNVTLESRQDADGLWEALPLIEDSERTTRAYFESLPPRKYLTEREAMAAAKNLAQEQIEKLEHKLDGF